MPKLTRFSFLLIFALVSSIAGQTPAPSPTPTQEAQQQPAPADDEDVVRITNNLIQFDVTVTDKNGKPVPDLRPEDFEILENDKAQTISNFSYISLAPKTAPAPVEPIDKNAPPIPPTHLRPDQVRRTIALVVDDLGLSFESVAAVRQALKNFLDKQMQPGDLVAIMRTRGGIGALQQFTTDKRRLYLALDRIRWFPLGRSGVGAFSPLQGQAASSALSGAKTSDPDADENEFREQLFSAGTLGAVNYIVRGLRDLPGRKSVILMSDGFRLMHSNGTKNDLTFDALRRLTDLANRSSVVIYTIDARGLPVLGLTAADNTSGMSARQVQQVFSNRSQELFDTQSGLNYLAKVTGGFTVHNNNDLAGGIKQIVADQSGYYLIGYHPDESTFDPKRLRYNTFKVKLNRKGLEIRYRNGFIGIADDKAKEAPKTTRAQIMASALMSPFDASDTQIQLTSLFGNDAQAGSFVRSFLHIRTQDLTFSDEADGGHQAIFDLLAVTFGENGLAIDQVSRTYTVHLRDEAYQHALKAGFIYVETVPVKKAGAYQLRFAVRDTASNRVGTASQFIEIPDLKKNRLVLSGLAAFGTDPAALNDKTAGGPQVRNLVSPEEDPEAGVALRRIRSGMILQYACYVYNAHIDKASGQPQLQTQVRLFRDGQEVYTGNAVAYDAKGQTDLQRLPLAGAVRLGTVLTPGQYVLQLVVTDALAKEKLQVATQWIDFEIVQP